jgi:hypothetical protein
MTPYQKRKLERLAKTLDEAQALIRELLRDEPTADVEQKPASKFDARTTLVALRAVERSAAEKWLDVMKQHELGALFVEAGGSSSDKKKPKIWLADQILWRIFDFEHGHETIRTKGSGEN